MVDPWLLLEAAVFLAVVSVVVWRTRGWRNVLGNGGVAGVAAVMYALDASNRHLYLS